MTQKSNREKLIELQEAMAEEQLVAARQVQTLLLTPAVDKMLADLADLQINSVPGQYLDQSINHITQVITGVRTTLEQQVILAEEAGTGAEAESPAPQA